MFRLKLVPDTTTINFFRFWRLTFGASVLGLMITIVSLFTMGLNFGIDFRGGTTIRTESSQAVDVGAYRQAIGTLGLGDVTITEVFDPGFRADQFVAMVRIQAQDGQEAVSPEMIAAVEAALHTVDPSVTFPSVESVGPKVSQELIKTALISVILANFGMMAYIWLRFEWQFAVGAAVALVHDALMTVGVFSLFQIKFDLTTIAALLTIIGYSVNDTVVIFDRVRENLIKFKQIPLKDVLNLTINETLSRTLMTSITTLLALIALFAFGGDVIRGFVFAMIFGVFVGCYSTVYVATVILWRLGVKRDWSKTQDDTPGTQFTTKPKA